MQSYRAKWRSNVKNWCTIAILRFQMRPFLSKWMSNGKHWRKFLCLKFSLRNSVRVEVSVCKSVCVQTSSVFEAYVRKRFRAEMLRCVKVVPGKKYFAVQLSRCNNTSFSLCGIKTKVKRQTLRITEVSFPCAFFLKKNGVKLSVCANALRQSFCFEGFCVQMLRTEMFRRVKVALCRSFSLYMCVCVCVCVCLSFSA